MVPQHNDIYQTYVLIVNLVARLIFTTYLFVEPNQLEHIIQGCKRNHEAAQHQLYKAYYSLFLKICYRYAKDEDEAMSMMHDSFLKIFRNIHQYEGKGSFEGWMKRTLVHCCIDYVRSVSKHAKVLDIDEVNERSFVNNTTIHTPSNILEELHVKEIVQLIQQLPSMTKIVFNLYVFEGFSHKEISLKVGIKEGTSHWHLSKARALLQAKMIQMHALPTHGYERK